MPFRGNAHWMIPGIGSCLSCHLPYLRAEQNHKALYLYQKEQVVIRSYSIRHAIAS